MISRDQHLQNLEEVPVWDFLIIGGGASGLGAAVDAASRGFKTVLFEHIDFAKGTSSRSTKLVHGGVRYLAQGNISLVREALEERGLLSENARHLFKKQRFIIPSYHWFKHWYYRFGLTLYDVLAGKLGVGKTSSLDEVETIEKLPNLIQKDLSGSIVYYDGQFNDARLALNLAQTAIEQGATVLNYMKVVELIKDAKGLLIGVMVQDIETKRNYKVLSKVVLNATGVFSNKVMALDGSKNYDLKIVTSQGVHLVLDASFLGGKDALMIPETKDGRVLFAVPWQGKLILGTTDTPVEKSKYEPLATEEEIDFILETAAQYLIKKPTRKDVLSVFAGLRPLVAPKGDKQNTKEISRGHKIEISNSGLISIVGGKWTTYRHMAEELVDKAITFHNLDNRPCKTRKLSIYGNTTEPLKRNSHFYVYGNDIKSVRKFIGQEHAYTQKIHPNYDYQIGEVIWSVRNEMARTVEDILARRNRLLFLDAKAAIEAAPIVAETLGNELKKDSEWIQQQIEEFTQLAKNYVLS